MDDYAVFEFCDALAAALLELPEAERAAFAEQLLDEQGTIHIEGLVLGDRIDIDGDGNQTTNRGGDGSRLVYVLAILAIVAIAAIGGWRVLRATWPGGDVKIQAPE